MASKKQCVVKAENGRGQYFAHKAVLLVVEGVATSRELFPSSVGLTSASPRYSVTHSVMFWALYVTEDVNQPECDWEGGQLQAVPFEEWQQTGTV